MARLEAKPTTTANDGSCSIVKNATPGNAAVVRDHDGHHPLKIADDEEELFELDIAILNRHDHDDISHRGNHHCTAVADDDDNNGHALLANCLLPVSSVSNAVPVAASSVFSAYPYSGYYGSRRLFTASSRRFLGRPGNSARFCLSSRGFETMGNYFQRY